MIPARPFDLHDDTFCRNLRSARRGVVPSGMTCEHKPLLESDKDSLLLCQVANLLARGYVPPTALKVLRLGRVTDLKKACQRDRGQRCSPKSGRPDNCETVRIVPWTSLTCVSSPKCVYMCVRRCPPPNTKCVNMCVTKCVYMCVTKCVYMCAPNAFICVSPNAFICVCNGPRFARLPLLASLARFSTV